MKITPTQLKSLAVYEYNISGETFVKKFIKSGGSESMARHLWAKFKGYNHSIVKLAGNLDSTNLRILSKTILLGYK